MPILAGTKAYMIIIHFICLLTERSQEIEWALLRNTSRLSDDREKE